MLGKSALLGRTEATSKASGAMSARSGQKAEEARRTQTESFNPYELRMSYAVCYYNSWTE